MSTRKPEPMVVTVHDPSGYRADAERYAQRLGQERCYSARLLREKAELIEALEQAGCPINDANACGEGGWLCSTHRVLAKHGATPPRPGGES